MARHEILAALEEELDRLTKLVYYDELTEILNRRGFLQEAEKAFRRISFGQTPIERRIRTQIPFSIIFIDLDGFKEINDNYGHDAGDLALKSVAAVLKEQLRSGDIFARWGGEEFIVALLGSASESAKIAAEKLCRGIENNELIINGERLKMNASLGIKTYDDDKSLIDIINCADKAMYEAKKQGKNQVVVFDGK